MKAAIIGLIDEGIKAANSFFKRKWHIYVSDLNYQVDLRDLELPLAAFDLSENNDSMSIQSKDFTIDIGVRNPSFIDDNDVVVFDPILWNSQIAIEIMESGKFIVDKFNKHKDLFTIAITGFFGSNITSLMLKDILTNAGYNVLYGGLAHLGYYDLILEANSNDYDFLIVDVDMDYLDFCNYVFDFDLVGLCNSQNNDFNISAFSNINQEKLSLFLTNKELFIRENDYFIKDLQKCCKKLNFYKETNDFEVKTKLYRSYASLASAIAQKINIPQKIINSSLNEFKPPIGNLNVYKLNDVEIYIDKFHNINNFYSILSEKHFYSLFLGTPSFHEDFKLEYLNKLIDYNLESIVLFPDEDDTIEICKDKLISIGFNGKIEIANSLDDLIAFVAEYSHEESIFISSFGKNAIKMIEERISVLSIRCA